MLLQFVWFPLMLWVVCHNQDSPRSEKKFILMEIRPVTEIGSCFRLEKILKLLSSILENARLEMIKKKMESFKRHIKEGRG